MLATALTCLVHVVGGQDCSGVTAKQVVSKFDLTGQTHVITGGDSGLGYQTALALSSAKATVIILSYDPTGRGAQAAKNITAETGNHVGVVGIDLSSLASVRTAANTVNGMVDKINVLICDAGIAGGNDGILTADGYEETFEVNYLGHHLLTELLLPKLRLTKGRVIDVSSDASWKPCVAANLPQTCTDINNLSFMATRKFVPGQNSSLGFPASNYAWTKFLMILHANQVAKREQSNSRFSPVLAFALHPGFVDTPMSANMPENIKKQWCKGQPQPCPVPANIGAATQSYLAAADYSNLRTNSGMYFEHCSLHGSIRDAVVKTMGEQWVESYQTSMYATFQKWTSTPFVESRKTTNSILKTSNR